jgi:hypothetical protein
LKEEEMMEEERRIVVAVAVKLSLGLIRHHVMKTYEGLELYSSQL